MKKIFALCAVVLVSTAAFAIEPGDGSKSTGLAVIKKNESTFNLFYQPASVTNVKVRIQDADGREVFSELVRKTDGFIRPYTLSGLRQGDYTITVTDGDQSFSETLHFSKSQAKSARIQKLSSNRYLVSIPAVKNGNGASVNIYEGGELSFQQPVDTQTDFSKIFNVKNLTGNISFSVIDSEGNQLN